MLPPVSGEPHFSQAATSPSSIAALGPSPFELREEADASTPRNGPQLCEVRFPSGFERDCFVPKDGLKNRRASGRLTLSILSLWSGLSRDSRLSGIGNYLSPVEAC